MPWTRGLARLQGVPRYIQGGMLHRKLDLSAHQHGELNRYYASELYKVCFHP